MDKRNMINDPSRQDSDAPLTGFSFPKVDMVKLRENMQLPDQFLRACTLKEGAWIIVLFMNAVAGLMIGFLMTLIIKYPEETEDWWHELFRDDFDYFYKGENLELINSLYPLWLPIAYVVIMVKAVYFFTGILVMYALLKKTADPCWYMPWLIVTALLILVQWLLAGVLTVCMFIMFAFREVTITWDLCPILLVVAYGILWTYCWFVVIAHHRRRRIVKYWKEKQMSTGSEVMGPQY